MLNLSWKADLEESKEDDLVALELREGEDLEVLDLDWVAPDVAAEVDEVEVRAGE